MNSDTAFLIALGAGYLAVLVAMLWPNTTHKCDEAYCPHRKREEEL